MAGAGTVFRLRRVCSRDHLSQGHGEDSEDQMNRSNERSQRAGKTESGIMMACAFAGLVISLGFALSGSGGAWVIVGFSLISVIIIGRYYFTIGRFH